MNLNETLLRELQQCSGAASLKCIGLNASIAQVNRGIRTWVNVKKDIEELAGTLEILKRRCDQTKDHIDLMVRKYEAKKRSLRTGIPVKDIVGHLARKFGNPN